jgi:ribosomal protein S18 acetylase RimI-like enzyme
MSVKIPISFQLARLEHTEIVVSLMRALEHDDPNKKPFDEQSRRSSYARFLVEPANGRLWLFETDRAFVGYMVLAFVFSFEYAGRNAFIDELYVVPEHRGQGIGWQALQFAEKAAREEEIGALHLEVSRNNSLAHKLYRRAGFADHDRYLLTKWLDAKQLE